MKNGESMTWADLKPGDALVGDVGIWIILRMEPYEWDSSKTTYTMLNLIDAHITSAHIKRRVRLDFFEVYKG